MIGFRRYAYDVTRYDPVRSAIAYDRDDSRGDNDITGNDATGNDTTTSDEAIASPPLAAHAAIADSETTGEDGAMPARPSREQFAVGPYLVQHRPTGAKFGAYPGERDVCYINWGRLAERCAAQDYRDELRRIAAALLRERPRY